MRYRFKNLAARFQGKIEMEFTLKAGLPRVRFETLRSGKSMLSWIKRYGNPLVDYYPSRLTEMTDETCPDYA
jgi:hypothetical protein